MKYAINLPWPHKYLFPNAGKSSLYKATYTRKARGDAKMVASSEFRKSKPEGHISITRVYSPPDRRKRDKDGMDAATKAYLDGIADALRVDDSTFDLEKSHIIEPVTHGNICFIIECKPALVESAG